MVGGGEKDGFKNGMKKCTFGWAVRWTGQHPPSWRAKPTWAGWGRARLIHVTQMILLNLDPTQSQENRQPHAYSDKGKQMKQKWLTVKSLV